MTTAVQPVDQRAMVRRAVEVLGQYVSMIKPTPKPRLQCADCTSTRGVVDNYGRAQCPGCRALFGPYSALLSEHGSSIEQPTVLEHEPTEETTPDGDRTEPEPGSAEVREGA